MNGVADRTAEAGGERARSSVSLLNRSLEDHWSFDDPFRGDDADARLDRVKLRVAEHFTRQTTKRSGLRAGALLRHDADDVLLVELVHIIHGASQADQ